jgi:DNA-binding transcriptional ArsR family regulator
MKFKSLRRIKRLLFIILNLVSSESYLEELAKRLKEARSTVCRDLTFLRRLGIIKKVRSVKCRGLKRMYLKTNVEAVLNMLDVGGRLNRKEKEKLIEGCENAATCLNEKLLKKLSDACSCFDDVLQAPLIVTFLIGLDVRASHNPLIKMPEPPNLKINRSKSEVKQPDSNEKWFLDENNWKTFESSIGKLVPEERIIAFNDAISEFTVKDIEAFSKIMKKLVNPLNECVLEIVKSYWRCS